MAVVVGPAPTDRDAAHGHVAGTGLDAPQHGTAEPVPRALVSLIVLAVAMTIYVVIGYRVVVEHHVVVFDALDRLTRAYMVWHNDPPKLAAVGFLFPPISTLVMLPVALIKPVATSLVALPLVSAFFGALTVMLLDRTLARCEMTMLLRFGALAVFALNPLWVFYSGNGMSEVVYASLLVFSLYCFVSWYTTTEPRFLIGAGFGMCVLILTRYGFMIYALLMMLLIGIALVRRQASKNEVEGSVIAFAAPVFYVAALWILFNMLIIGEPFGWLTDATSTQAVNATGIDTARELGVGDIASRVLELNVAVFPLAFFVVPALLITFVTQRNDLALWLAAFVVLGVVIMSVNAYTSENEGLLTLRDSIPMYVVSFVGAGWLYRSFPTFRMGIWALIVGLLVINMVTAWNGMRNYPFQSLEQAFTRVFSTGEDQQDLSSIGGYTVGVRAEAAMAAYVKANVRGNNTILTDNAKTFGVILLSGRPEIFFDRVDRGDARFRQVLANPQGTVRYLLLTVNARSGDVIQRAYPDANNGTSPGLTPVYRTDRYVLVRVADRGRGAPVPRANPDGTSLNRRRSTAPEDAGRESGQPAPETRAPGTATPPARTTGAPATTTAAPSVTSPAATAPASGQADFAP